MKAISAVFEVRLFQVGNLVRRKGSRSGKFVIGFTFSLSGDLFQIQINPLIVFLNVYPMIEKYTSLSNKEYLTFAFMDDANLVTSNCFQKIADLVPLLF